MDINQMYRDKQRLLSNITPWWVGNGWSKQTLNSKSHSELLGIHRRMMASKSKTGTSRSGQVRMYN